MLNPIGRPSLPQLRHLHALLLSSLVCSGAASAAAHEEPAAAPPSIQARWQASEIVLHVDDSIDWIGPGAFEAVIAAVSAWQQSNPELPTLVVERTRHGHVGYDGYGPAHNVLRYEPHGTPLTRGALAITIATKDANSGTMLDADIVFNGKFPFAVVDPNAPPEERGPYDFQNVLTHELGHYLGISEENSVDAEATMYVTSARGETHKRDLATPDLAGIETLYTLTPEEEALPGMCGGASVARLPRAGGQPWWALAVLALAVLRRKR